MTYQDLYDRLTEIKEKRPELLEKEAFFLPTSSLSEFWEWDDSKEERCVIPTELECERIDGITTVIDHLSQEEVIILHE